jgi:MFS family permease
MKSSGHHDKRFWMYKKEKDPSEKIRPEVFVYTILIFISMFSLTLIAPALGKLVDELFDEKLTVGSLFVSLEMIAYIIFAMVWGALSDRKGKRKIFIFIGFAGSAVMYFLMTQATSFSMLLVFRFIQGAITVMAWSLVMTGVLDITPKKNYGKVMGIVGAGMGFGMGMGAPIGGRIAESFGILAPLYVAGILFILAAVLTLLFIKETPIKNRPETFFKAFKVLVERKKLAIPYAYGFVDRLTVGFFVYVFVNFMHNKFAAGPGQIGMLLAVFLIPFALLQYPFGRLSDRIGRWQPLVFGSLFYGIVMATIGFTGNMGDSGRTVLIFIMLLCGFLGAMMFPPSIALSGDWAPKDKRGAAIGGFNVFGSLGFAVGPILGSFIADNYSYELAFIVGGATEMAVALITLPFLLKYARKKKKK